MNTDKIYAEQIANEYAPKENSNVKALKRLDAKVKNAPKILAFSVGIVSSLIMGTGMSLAMQVIGNGSTLVMALGIVIGCIGILGVSVNYPIYKKNLESNKRKYASDILKLAKEISEGN